MNAVTKSEPQQPAVNALVPRGMAEAMQLAEMMMRAKMLPAHLHNSPGDCLMVVEQAMRWGMSPFAVAQCTSSIQGKLMFEGKLIAAAIEASGAIVGSLDYEFTGAGNDRKITVSGTRRGEANPRTVEILLKDAATSNQLWKKQPDQQLVYHGARVWGRRWTPGVVLGVYSREEFEGVTIDVGTIDARPEPAPPVDSTPPRVDANSRPIADAAPKRPTVQQFLDTLALELAHAKTLDEVNAILNREDVANVAAFVKNGARDRYIHMRDEATARVIEPPDDLPDLDLPDMADNGRMEA